MEVVGLALVLLLAQATATLAASREYHLVNEPKTWAEAQTYCRENFVDLATIETEEDQAKVADLIRNDPALTEAWIGLHTEDVDTWRWSLDNTSLDNSVYSLLQFFFDNASGRQYCAFLQSYVGDNDCHKPYFPLCYDESSNTYIPVNVGMSWQSARTYCKQEHTDLAIVRTQQEQDAAKAVIDSSQRWWIGLSRENWKWSGQTNFLFGSWATGKPNTPGTNCVVTMESGWDDSACTSLHPFICSVPIRKVLKVEIKTNGKVNLNDPLVQEAILRQVEKDMKARGIKQDVKLTWRNQPTGNVFN